MAHASISCSVSLMPCATGSITHRTGLTSVANVDTYLRALAPDASKGYGAIYYANSAGVTYSQHTNRYYVIAVTPLSGGGEGQ